TLREAGLVTAGDAPPRLRRLAGGWWNDVWRLRAPGRDWVVKLFADGGGSTLFPMLPDEEGRALELPRGPDLAPEPVASLPRAAGRRAWLVYRFHPGSPWRRGVAQVAELLRRQHALAPAGLRHVATQPAQIVTEGDTLLDGVAGAGAVRALR